MLTDVLTNLLQLLLAYRAVLQQCGLLLLQLLHEGDRLFLIDEGWAKKWWLGEEVVVG
jgi:hypothetical protein